MMVWYRDAASTSAGGAPAGSSILKLLLTGIGAFAERLTERGTGHTGMSTSGLQGGTQGGAGGDGPGPS
eukprot:COSAG02_NODE_3734_length_6311_cov_70.627173_7_plen_69_part_00